MNFIFFTKKWKWSYGRYAHSGIRVWPKSRNKIKFEKRALPLKNNSPDSKADLTKLRPLGVYCWTFLRICFGPDECRYSSPSLHNLGIPRSIYQVCSGTMSVCPFLYQRPVFPTLKFSFLEKKYAPLEYILEKSLFLSKIAAWN